MLVVNGLCTKVRLHDGKDDDTGRQIRVTKITGNKLTYIVNAEDLIKVKVTNRGSSIALKTIYMNVEGEEEPDKTLHFNEGEEHELPFPLQKPVGEADDGWELRNEAGKTILELVFEVGEAVVFESEEVQDHSAPGPLLNQLQAGTLTVLAQAGNVKGPDRNLTFEIRQSVVTLLDHWNNQTGRVVNIIVQQNYRGSGADFCFKFDDGSERFYGFKMTVRDKPSPTGSLRKFFGAFITG